MDVSRLVVSAVRLAAPRRLAPRGARTLAGARPGPSGGRPRRPWRSTRRDPGVASAEGWPWREGRVLGSLGAGCRQGRVTACNPSGGSGGGGGRVSCPRRSRARDCASGGGFVGRQRAGGAVTARRAVGTFSGRARRGAGQVLGYAVYGEAGGRPTLPALLFPPP